MTPEAAPKRASRLSRGSALLSSMLILALMTVLAVGSLRTVMRDRQVAGFQKRARTAMYSSEAGIAVARALLHKAPTSDGVAALQNWQPNPAFPDSATPQYIGSGTNPPRFYADGGHTGIEFAGFGKNCTTVPMSQEWGQTQARGALWDVRVTGETNDGTQKVVQALVKTCFFGN